MPNIPFSRWYKNQKMKKRDAYRWLEQHQDKAVKEIHEVVQKRRMWVLCIDESVKP